MHLSRKTNFNSYCKYFFGFYKVNNNIFQRHNPEASHLSTPQQSINVVDPLSALFTTHSSSLDSGVYNHGNNSNFQSKETMMGHVHLNQDIDTNLEQKCNLFTKTYDKKDKVTSQANNNVAVNKIVQDNQVTIKYDIVTNEMVQYTSESEEHVRQTCERQTTASKEFVRAPASNHKLQHLSINRSTHPLTPPSSPGKTTESLSMSGSILAIPQPRGPASCLIPLPNTVSLSMLEKQRISTQIISLVPDTNIQG